MGLEIVALLIGAAVPGAIATVAAWVGGGVGATLIGAAATSEVAVEVHKGCVRALDANYELGHYRGVSDTQDFLRCVSDKNRLPEAVERVPEFVCKRYEIIRIN